MYPLKNSDASRISSMLASLVQQGLYKPGMLAAGNNQMLAAREKVAITVDIRTNVLIVSASKENFKVIEEILDKIDTGEDFNALADIRMYTLKRADATRLGPVLQTFFNAKRAGETAAGGAVKTLPAVIQTDTRTNTLLVAGSRETFSSVEAMIQKLDGDQTLTGADFRVFFLKQAVVHGPSADAANSFHPAHRARHHEGPSHRRGRPADQRRHRRREPRGHGPGREPHQPAGRRAAPGEHPSGLPADEV